MRKLTHEEIITRQRENRPPARFPISGLLHDVRSLYNVGSMFRTADGANLSQLYLSGITGTPPHPGIQKTALGAEKVVPWKKIMDPVLLVGQLKKDGVQILALEQTQHSLALTRTDLPVTFPCCLVVGSEISGVLPELVEAADLAVEIPMFGIKNSLNVSVAFAIAIYELVAKYCLHAPSACL